MKIGNLIALPFALVADAAMTVITDHKTDLHDKLRSALALVKEANDCCWHKEGDEAITILNDILEGKDV